MKIDIQLCIVCKNIPLAIASPTMMPSLEPLSFILNCQQSCCQELLFSSLLQMYASLLGQSLTARHVWLGSFQRFYCLRMLSKNSSWLLDPEVDVNVVISSSRTFQPHDTRLYRYEHTVLLTIEVLKSPHADS